MRTEGDARLAPSPPHPGGKPLSVTLSKVRNFQSVSMWQVQQLHWTGSLISVGVISSSWHADNNMAEMGERQNVWEAKLSAQHVCLRTSSRPWPRRPFSARPRRFSAIVCGRATCPTAGRVRESAREWSVARAIPQVSDIWSPGLIGPRRAWLSARTIMPQARPIRLWSNGGRALCCRKLIRPPRTTQVKKREREREKRQGRYFESRWFPSSGWLYDEASTAMMVCGGGVGGGFPSFCCKASPWGCQLHL